LRFRTDEILTKRQRKTGREMRKGEREEKGHTKGMKKNKLKEKLNCRILCLDRQICNCVWTVTITILITFGQEDSRNKMTQE
jgi:hypothetical protein